VPKIPFVGLEPQQVALAFARPEFIRFARFDIAGVENIPRGGPAIVCANHRSYFDVAAMALLLAKTGRPARFLGKKEVFDAPVVGSVARAMGGIRVERGTGSSEPLEQAAVALEGGQLVVVMPQGTIPRGEAFFDPVLKGRWGPARLAARTKAPVIPVGLWGTERVWPRSSRVPNVVNVVRPPLVQVRVGPPVELSYIDLQKDTEQIMDAIVALLPAEAREKHVPTVSELARTLPPDYNGDPDHESARRPGSD
jgi:putative phosphoserine phosphatase/1-acylglycerol-3-phosphate O-acyltransferase